MTRRTRAIAALAWLPMLVLPAGCYVLREPLIDAESSAAIADIGEGIYCHAENKLDPPVVGIAPAISESLGANRCRDLHWLAEDGRYIDRMSPSMIFRTAESGIEGLSILQVQTGETSAPRLAPLVAVDGLFIMYDPMGEWPRDRVAEAGLALSVDGVLEATAEETLPLVTQVWQDALERFRRDVTLVETGGSPLLAFADIATAYSYIVYFREEWHGDAERMGGALRALADRLALNVRTD